MSAAHPVPPQAILSQILLGHILTQAVYAVASLNVADHLARGPRTAEELARATGTHPGALYRFIRCLAAAGVFSETDDGRFTLTPIGECLRSDIPGSLRDTAIFIGCPWRWRIYEDVLHSVRTGQPACDRVHGAPAFESMAQNPEVAEIFNRAMVSFTSTIAPAVAAAYDFSPFTRILDVAGGHGYLIATILKANPHLHGVLFDLPAVVRGAPPLLHKAGVADRCEIVSGDFFHSVPAGAGVITMKHIIHDWDDERALTILRNCHHALPAHGKLLLIETVVRAGNEPSLAKSVDLEMLLIPGGKERTEAEYRDLFAASGFHLNHIIPTESHLQVIEAARV